MIAIAFSAIAPKSWSLATSIGISADLTGEPIAAAEPASSVDRITQARLTAPVPTMIAVAAITVPPATWVMISILRRSQRSAHAPACKTRSAAGRPSVNTTRPWTLSLRDRPSSTSHPNTNRWALVTRKNATLLNHRFLYALTDSGLAGRSVAPAARSAVVIERALQRGVVGIGPDGSGPCPPWRSRIVERRRSGGLASESGESAQTAHRVVTWRQGDVVMSTTTAAWSLGHTSLPSTSTGPRPTSVADIGLPIGLGRGHDTST